MLTTRHENNNNPSLKITEKPKNPTSNLAVTGIYLLTPLIFEIIDNLKPSWRNELEITDALDNLLRQNNNISFERIPDYWKDTGTPEDIIHANGEIIKKMLENLENDHIIGKDTVIESNVKINGPVVIGDNCHISSGSSIGPNVSVGNNTTVAISNIENSIVMENCKINSSAEIKNSIIANNSDIKDDEGAKKIFLLGEGSKVSL